MRENLIDAQVVFEEARDLNIHGGSEAMSTVNQDEGGVFDSAEIIYSYSRAQAIEDGELVDFSKLAGEAGFNYPVAVTCAVYADCVMWTERDAEVNGPQDETGRMWDILTMLKLAISANRQARVITFRVRRAPRADYGSGEIVTLKAVVGPGDTPAPVITIMGQGED